MVTGWQGQLVVHVAKLWARLLGQERAGQILGIPSPQSQDVCATPPANTPMEGGVPVWRLGPLAARQPLLAGQINISSHSWGCLRTGPYIYLGVQQPAESTGGTSVTAAIKREGGGKFEEKSKRLDPLDPLCKHAVFTLLLYIQLYRWVVSHILDLAGWSNTGKEPAIPLILWRCLSQWTHGGAPCRAWLIKLGLMCSCIDMPSTCTGRLGGEGAEHLPS